MPGEIQRPYEPPDTPEWREVFRELDEWVKRRRLEREAEENEEEQDAEKPLPW